MRNKQKIAEYNKKYRSEHKDEIYEYNKKYRSEHKDEISKYMKKYCAEHKDERAVYRAEHSGSAIESSRKWRQALKLEIVKEYGEKCVCCGETYIEFLTIDHIDGSGSQHRKIIGNSFYIWLKKSGFPKDNFRLLCMNCNFSMGAFGYCPHERKQ